MVHLDTNFLAQALVPGTTQEGKLKSWLDADEALGISTIALAEFLCGPLPQGAETLINRMLPSPEPFLRSDAVLAADLFNRSGRRSRSLSDCMIAAVALRSNAALATANIGDFRPFETFGLRIA
jgi:predicted nucleic acid-binding protein